MNLSDEQVRANYAKFQMMLTDLAREIDDAPVEILLERTQLAALFAWSKSCGFFSSPELEALIGRLSARLPTIPVERNRDSAGRRQVLIVMSAAYGAGGHSRLASRWIQLDTMSDYTVAFTMPDNLTVPDRFRSLADSGKIRLVLLDQPSFSARAVALRQLVSQTDYVVLLIHPHDVIPNAALAAMPDAPPVLFQDHASHTFWLGATVSRLILSETGTLVTRRGIPARHICWNPLPMDFRGFAELPTVDIRSLYRIPADVPLLLTCGASFKYCAVDGISLATLLAPLFEREPSLHLLVAGVGLPGMPFTRDWEPLMNLFGSRIRLMGRIDEATLNACYRAADVYLDSAPQSSPTTMFEAAACGLPVVRFARQDWRESEFSLDMETLPTAHYIWADEEDYRDDIVRLLHDRGYCEWRSRFGRQAVELVHADSIFLNAVETAYRRASAMPLIGVSASAGECRIDRLSDLLDQLFENLLSQDSLETDWKVYAVAASLAAKGEVGEAMSRMLSLAEKGTTYWQVYNDLGVYALNRGDLVAAVEVLRHAVSISSRPNTAYLNLAKALLLHGSRDDAQDLVESYLRRFPCDEGGQEIMAMVHKT